MEVLNRYAIKREARAFIGEDTKWLKMLLAMLPYLLLTGATNFGITVYETVNEIYNGTTTYSTSFNFITVLLIPFGVALSGYFLNCIRGFNPEWKSPYREGLDRYGKYLGVGFITNLIIVLWALLFIIPGIIKGYAYSQVNYIIHDNPNLTPKQAREISDRMTQGFKGELFVLDLSFILWYFLVGITFGIAIIYVKPYTQTVSAMYYENLKSHAMATGRVHPVEFGILPTPPYADVPPMQGAAPYVPQQPMGYSAPQQPPVSGDAGYTAPQQPPVSGNMGYTAPQQPPVSDNMGYTAPQQPPVSENVDAEVSQQPSVLDETSSIDVNFYLQNEDFTPPAPEDTFRPGTDELFGGQSNPEQEQ